MNLDIELDRCVKKANAKYGDLRAAKIICNNITDSLRDCKQVCISQDNEKQNMVLSKCLESSKNDAQLDECIKNSAKDSVLRICQYKCDLSGVANYKFMQPN